MEEVELAPFSTDIDVLSMFVKTLRDNFGEDINIFRPTEPIPLVIYVQEEDVALKIVASLVI